MLVVQLAFLAIHKLVK